MSVRLVVSPVIEDYREAPKGDPYVLGITLVKLDVFKGEGYQLL